MLPNYPFHVEEFVTSNFVVKQGPLEHWQPQISPQQSLLPLWVPLQARSVRLTFLPC